MDIQDPASAPPSSNVAPNPINTPSTAHFSSNTPSTTDQSVLTPSTTDQLVRNRRARPTISCLECRRKKLKCDREKPCSQCFKAGRESLCVYASAPIPIRRSNGLPRVTQTAAFEDEARKRARLEGNAGEGNAAAWLIAPSGSQYAEEQRSEFRSARTSERLTSLGKVYAKGQRSRYLGMADRMVMMLHFEDAKSFIMSAFREQDVCSMMVEMSKYQTSMQSRRSIHVKSVKLVEGPILGRTGIISHMLKAMPSDYTSILLVEAYHLHWETLSRVLYLPIFDGELCDVMKAKKNGDSILPRSVKEYAVPQGLAAFALVARFVKRRVPDKEDVSELQIAKWTDLIRRWLEDLTGKERLDIQALRTQTLLLLVYQNNLAPASDLWRESGNLVRSAMTMGLHRDPESCKDFSPFAREQRRKLWRTIVELDIQFSTVAGMPTAIHASDFHSGPLLNVDDLDLAEEMTESTLYQDNHRWTDAIAQVALGPSINERLDAVNILGGEIDLENDTPSLLNRARSLEQCLLHLPTPIASVETPSRGDDKLSSKLFTKIMLDVYIRRPSLGLYRAIALSAVSTHYPEARNAAVKSSIVVLSQIDALDPTVADLSTIKDRDLLNLFHALCKSDIMQAALMICFEIQRLSMETTGLPPGLDEVSWTKHSLTRIVENTLSSLIQQLGEFGSDLKDILPLSVVLQSVRSNGTTQEKREMMRNGAERVLRACRTTLPPLESPAQQIIDSAALPPRPSQPSPLPFYWTPDANPMFKSPESTPRAVEPCAFAELNLMGGEIDFRDFEFDFGEWVGDLAWE